MRNSVRDNFNYIGDNYFQHILKYHYQKYNQHHIKDKYFNHKKNIFHIIHYRISKYINKKNLIKILANN
jgi:hypothetical protein